MELVLAVLMGLGIFLVIPVMIGFAVVGIYLLKNRRIKIAERKRALASAVEDMERIITEADFDQPEKLDMQEDKEPAEVK